MEKMSWKAAFSIIGFGIAATVVVAVAEAIYDAALDAAGKAGGSK